MSPEISLEAGWALPVVFIGLTFAGSRLFIKNRPKKPLSGDIFCQNVGFTSPAANSSNVGKYKLCVTSKWSKQCATLQLFAAGFQLSCSAVRPTNVTLASSATFFRLEVVVSIRLL